MATLAEFHDTEYGGEALDGLDANQTLSTKKLTQLTLALSDVATVIVPCTTAPLAGEVICT